MRRLIIGIILTSVALVLLVRLIDWQETLDALKATNPWYIALAVLFLIASVALKTVRWQMLLPPEPQLGLWRLYRILHISFFLNNVLPARLGDVARVGMTSSPPGPRIGAVISSLLTERVTDTVMLIASFVLVSPFLPLPEEYSEWVLAAWYLIAGIVVLALVVWFLREHIGRVFRSMPIPGALGKSDRVREEAQSFAEGMRQLFTRQRLLPIWGYSAAAWICAFAINVSIMYGMDIDAPMAVAVLLTCTTNLAMLIPSSPGYIGVFHAAATLVLLPFGVGASEALSFAIVAHLVNVVPVSLIGAGCLLAGKDGMSLNWKTWRRKPGPTEQEAITGATGS